MKKIFLIILTIASFSAFAQKNDTDLKTQINSQIKTVTLSPGRVGAVLDSLVDGKQSLYADPKTITGTTYTVQNFDVGKTLHATHASGTTITITNTLPTNMVFNVVRDAGAGTVTFVAGGTASLSTIGGELTLESEVIAVTWIKKTATVFQGFGALGPAAGGGSVTDVTGTTNRITSTGGTTPQIDISTSYAGQNSITNVGTLTAGATGVGFTIALGTSTVTGLGTGVLTALGVNVGSAGAVVVNGGALGTPSSGVATNLTGTASGLTAGTVTTNANLTGAVTSTGNATSLGSFSSSNLSTALTDESGSGLVQFSELLTTTQTGTTYTLQTSDRNSIIRFTNAGSITLTIPTNASAAIQVGTSIWIKGVSSGVMTFSVSGITYTTTSGTLTSPGAAGSSFNVLLTKSATDTWEISNGNPPPTSGNGIAYSGSGISFNIGALTSSTNISGSFGLGRGVSPTALFHLGAGTGSANFAPLKFTDGTQLATSEPLVLEPATGGENLLFTNQANTFTKTMMGALVGTSTLNFPSIAATGGTQTLTITVTGAALSDEIILGIPSAAVTAGVVWFAYVNATNSVTVVATNCTAGALDPASGSFKVSVIKR